MKDYSRAQTIDHYFELIDSGKMGFAALRKKLEERDLPKEEISIVVSQVDKQLMRANQKRADHKMGKNLFIGGLCISGLGVLLTVGSYSGLIDLGSVYLIGFGPIAGGLLIALKGKSKMS